MGSPRRRKPAYAFSQLAIVPARSPSQNSALAKPKNASGTPAVSRTAEKASRAPRQSPVAMARNPAPTRRSIALGSSPRSRFTSASSQISHQRTYRERGSWYGGGREMAASSEGAGPVRSCMRRPRDDEGRPGVVADRGRRGRVAGERGRGENHPSRPAAVRAAGSVGRG